jgi:acyl dehydratase
MAKIFESKDALLASAGTPLGETEWVQITQERVNQFAEATGDHQWIHVDPARAKDGPFGACIAHGYLTLSMVSLFMPQLLDVRNTKMGINYGCDKVRFITPVRVGKRVRGRGEVVKAEPVEGGAQVWTRTTVEVEGEARPACVAETISRFIF